MGIMKNADVNVCCEVCGKIDGPCFEVRLGGVRHVFDSFECAMNALSPRCGYCGCRIHGHSIVLGRKVFCSYQCANDDNVREYEKHLILRQQANY